MKLPNYPHRSAITSALFCPAAMLRKALLSEYPQAKGKSRADELEYWARRCWMRGIEIDAIIDELPARMRDAARGFFDARAQRPAADVSHRDLLIAQGWQQVDGEWMAPDFDESGDPASFVLPEQQGGYSNEQCDAWLFANGWTKDADGWIDPQGRRY